MYLSFSVPYAVWLLTGFFRTVPLEIEEAARIDGANKMQTFVQVVLPLVAPGVVATAIYTFINTWNEFLYALILMNNTSKMTVAVALRSLDGAEILDWGDMMAASALVVLPSVIFFCLIQNKIAGGMSEGAVKSDEFNRKGKGVIFYGSYNGNHWIRRGGLRLFRGGAGTHHEYKTRGPDTGCL